MHVMSRDTCQLGWRQSSCRYNERDLQIVMSLQYEFDECHIDGVLIGNERAIWEQRRSKFRMEMQELQGELVVR